MSIDDVGLLLMGVAAWVLGAGVFIVLMVWAWFAVAERQHRHLLLLTVPLMLLLIGAAIRGVDLSLWFMRDWGWLP